MKTVLFALTNRHFVVESPAVPKVLAAGGVMEVVALSVWCVVSASSPFCVDDRWVLAVARLTYGGRGSMDSAVCWFSGGGRRGGGAGRPVEILSLALFFVVVWLLLASPWGCWGSGGEVLVLVTGDSRLLGVLPARSCAQHRGGGPVVVDLVQLDARIVCSWIWSWLRRCRCSFTVSDSGARRRMDIVPKAWRCSFSQGSWSTAFFSDGLLEVEVRLACVCWCCFFSGKVFAILCSVCACICSSI